MSVLAELDVGDVAVINGTLTDPAGEPVTGATVTVRALHNGVETDLGAAVEDPDGVYSVTFAPATAGVWRVRFDAAAPAQAAEECAIRVRASGFAVS